MKQKNYKMYEIIIEEIVNNSQVTEKYIADKYLISERTVRRYFKDLKDNKKIKLIIRGKFREWIIL